MIIDDMMSKTNFFKIYSYIFFSYRLFSFFPFPLLLIPTADIVVVV